MQQIYEWIWSGSVAGVYVGTEYGIERIRGTRDWVCTTFISHYITYTLSYSFLQNLWMICFETFAIRKTQCWQARRQEQWSLRLLTKGKTRSWSMPLWVALLQLRLSSLTIIISTELSIFLLGPRLVCYIQIWSLWCGFLCLFPIKKMYYFWMNWIWVTWTLSNGLWSSKNSLANSRGVLFITYSPCLAVWSYIT